MFTARAISAFVLLFVLSACASSPEDGFPLTADDAAAYDAARVRANALELEVTRLKSENARLASMLLDMQRDLKDLSAETSDAKLPPAPKIRVPDPKPLTSAVVEDANAPELATEDVPVEQSPRLVQPAFASVETVFENEAEDEIETTSVLHFGVHLASYRKEEDAREGWQKLQRENPDQLGLLEPRVEYVAITGKGVFLRLVGGGFSSREKAEQLCLELKQNGLFCSVVSFNGQRLSLAE